MSKNADLWPENDIVAYSDMEAVRRVNATVA